MLTLKQIEAFYWVGTLGGFGAAAVKLNIAQSTISKRIQELEERLQVPLFDRETHTGRLTAQGMAVMPVAEEMLRLEQRLRDAVSSPRIYSGTFRIGVTELVSQMLGASQVGRTVPRKPAAVTTDMNVGELAVRGALSFASSRKTAA